MEVERAIAAGEDQADRGPAEGALAGGDIPKQLGVDEELAHVLGCCCRWIAEPGDQFTHVAAALDDGQLFSGLKFIQ